MASVVQTREFEPSLHREKSQQGDRWGGGARTGTDGHGRTRPTQPTQPTRPTHPIHPNKTKVQSDPTREEARKELFTARVNTFAVAPKRAEEKVFVGLGSSMVDWVQCDRCSKWRVLPPASKHTLSLAKWFCELNSDLRFASCSVPEQSEAEADAEAEEHGLPDFETQSNPVGASAMPQDIYLVEKLIAQRSKGGRRQFRVRWIGYTEADDTWEFEENIIDTRLIAEFLRENLKAAAGANEGTETEPLLREGLRVKARYQASQHPMWSDREGCWCYKTWGTKWYAGTILSVETRRDGQHTAKVFFDDGDVEEVRILLFVASPALPSCLHTRTRTALASTHSPPVSSPGRAAAIHQGAR